MTQANIEEILSSEFAEIPLPTINFDVWGIVALTKSTDRIVSLIFCMVVFVCLLFTMITEAYRYAYCTMFSH